MPDKEKHRRTRSPDSDDDRRKPKSEPKTKIKQEPGFDSDEDSRRRRKHSPSPKRGSKRSPSPHAKRGDQDSKKSKSSEHHHRHDERSRESHDERSRGSRDDRDRRPQRGASPERRPQRGPSPPSPRRFQKADGVERGNVPQPRRDDRPSGFPPRKNKYGDEEVDESKFEYGRRADEPPPDPKPQIPDVAKEKPNFELSGKLSEDQRKLADGTILKYQEPAEARMPTRRWRLYIFKGDENIEPIPLHRQSCYLLGRERKLADIPLDHPSCSKQHAVIQYRDIRWQTDEGDFKHEVRPYIMDLQSTNGVYLNQKRIDHSRYYEVKEKDVLKFGFSSRDYVFLHEQSLNS
eukprot:TRINITY_DN9292_c0_g1_i1.p1 TRINITY_DN9292_c0_g1~~TRINITY_DN9292_c0_g1_i1.p1  ORF type:complete len:348 (+),score=-4.18 TRINITY_DN9292_c0_g1_i1:34-1077(+)